MSFWDKGNNQEPVSEYEMIKEIMPDQEIENVRPVNRNDSSPHQSLISNSSYELSKSDSSILEEAELRLQQAKLYEMLIKHDIFEGVTANPTALRNVQEELKNYIIERLEILLGIRQRTAIKEEPTNIVVESDFNDIEIEFLKKLSYMGTKGESTKGKARNAQVTVQEQPKEVSLRPLRIKENRENTPKIVPANIARPILASQSNNVQREVRRSESENVVKKVPQRKTIEQLAMEDIQKMKDRKPIGEMTTQELLDANAKIKSTGKKKPKNALPAPAIENLVAHYSQQQNSGNVMSSGGVDITGLVNNIVSKKNRES